MVRTQNLDDAIAFLVASIDKKTKGSKHSYFPFNPLSPWRPPYPETTGYIIPTLLTLSERDGYKHLAQHGLDMADWILTLQDETGGLPGWFITKERQENSIFNTAQMIYGLVAAYKFTKDNKYKDAAERAGRFLSNNQNPDGTWVKFNYHGLYNPSYYSRVAWAMLEVSTLCGAEDVELAAKRCLDRIVGLVQENTFIKDSAFTTGNYAFLHTIAYTIRGMIESARLTGDEAYWNAGYNWAHKLMRKFEIKKKFAGAYYEDFKEVKWYRCLTGEAQMAIIWLKIFEKTNDPRFVSATSKLIDQIAATQPKSNFFYKKGGIKGSHPFYGRYIPLRQPNWATKFFIDALLLEESALAKVEQAVNP